MAKKFYTKPTWTTCRKARSYLAEKGIEVETVDLNRGLSVEELDRLIGKRDYLPFLNAKNEIYRELNMKMDPPAREEALRLMAAHPNLIRRPLLVEGGKVLFGFKAEEWSELE